MSWPGKPHEELHAFMRFVMEEEGRKKFTQFWALRQKGEETYNA